MADKMHSTQTFHTIKIITQAHYDRTLWLTCALQIYNTVGYSVSMFSCSSRLKNMTNNA